jgi:hypothetical protein
LQPKSRQCHVECGQQRHEIVSKHGAIRSAKPCDRYPVPRGDTDFTRKPFAAITCGSDRLLVAGYGQHCRNGYAATCDCRPRKLVGDCTIETDVLGKNQLATASYAPPIGEAAFVWDGEKHVACPAEGGHCDFAPRTPIEAELWATLRRDGHVSYERVASGSTIAAIRSALDQCRASRCCSGVAR